MQRLARQFAAVAAILAVSAAQAWDGMPTPKLTVNGRYLQDPSGKNVLLHGWFQPQASWFNGEGNRYANPTDYTNPSNVAGALNFLRDAADVMTDTSPKYGRNHGWYSSFVRIIGDGSSPENFAPGWDANGNLASSAQFNGYPGKDVTIARRKGELWYVGGINGEWEEKRQTLSFDYLPAGGKYRLTLIADGEHDKAFNTQYQVVESESSLEVRMLPRGGFAASLEPIQ